MAVQIVDISPEIHGFLEDLMEEADVLIADPILKEEMIQELADRLDRFLFIAITKKMSKDTSQEFIKMIQEEKPRIEIDKFLKQAIPNIETEYKDAMAYFRTVYLEGGNK